MDTKYTGNIYNIFIDVLSKKDGFSVGEKLTSLEKLLGKKYFYASDKEIYEAMEKYTQEAVEIDEPYEKDTDFAGFVEIMMGDKQRVTTFGVGTFYKD